MTVRYIAYQPPRRVAMTMVEGPWYFSRFAGAWVLRQTEDDRTRVAFRYHLKLHWGVRIVEGLVAIWMGWVTQRRLEALKCFAEGAGKGRRSG